MMRADSSVQGGQGREGKDVIRSAAFPLMDSDDESLCAAWVAIVGAFELYPASRVQDVAAGLNSL
jgi:hypothetical protein